jgi:hypothetical protein
MARGLTLVGQGFSPWAERARWALDLRRHAGFPTAVGPAQPDTWARPALAARWEDLLAWRDMVIDLRRSGS